MPPTPKKSIPIPTFSPVPRGKHLLAGLKEDWNTNSDEASSQEKQDDGQPSMVPRCYRVSPSPGKRTGPLSSNSAAESAAKIAKLSPARDINSNKWAPGQEQGYLSLYKVEGREENTLQFEVGDDLCTSPVFKSKSRSTTPLKAPLVNTSPPSKMEMKTSSTSSSTVRRRSVDSSQLFVQAIPRKKYQPDGGFVSSFLDMMTKAPLPVENTLENIKPSSVLHKLEVEDILDRNKDKVDRVMAKMLNKMVEVNKIEKRGLVHWGGGGEDKWTCLGEKDNNGHQRTDWSREGLRSRTRAASRWRLSYEEDAGFDNDEGVMERSGEDFYEFDASDQKETGRKVYKKITKDDFIDDEQGDYNSLASQMLEKKTVKGRGKGTGRGKRLGVDPKDKFIDDNENGEWLEKGKGKLGKGRGVGKGRGNLTKTPGVDTYFDPLEGVPASSALPMSKVEHIDGTENDNSATTSNAVSPTTAICNKVLLGSCSRSTGADGYTRAADICSRVLYGSSSSSGASGYTRASTERTGATDKQMGTCPLCMQQIEMDRLEYHASGCDG